MRPFAQSIAGCLTVFGGLMLGALGGCFAGLSLNDNGAVIGMVAGGLLGLLLALYVSTRSKKE